MKNTGLGEEEEKEKTPTFGARLAWKKAHNLILIKTKQGRIAGIEQRRSTNYLRSLGFPGISDNRIISKRSNRLLCTQVLYRVECFLLETSKIFFSPCLVKS